ncbi:MAG: PPC domain-containing DNA-binding protein [Thermodesulfobacteriota bacterium]
MISAEGSLGRVFVLRLEDKDTIPGSIEEFASTHRIDRAFCVALGGIAEGKLVTGPQEGSARPVIPTMTNIEDVHELVAVGTLFPAADGTPRLHMHGALGREGTTRTGCVRAGLEVWQVCEVVLVEILGVDMERVLDLATGFEVLSRR